MGIKIAGCWDVWESAGREHEIHWRYMTKHFGVDTLYMTPITGIAETLSPALDYTECEFIELPTIQDVIDANPEFTPIIVDENGTTALKDFIHPENVLYLFGKVAGGLLDKFGDSYDSVRIPSWSKYSEASLALLHPHQAASIVLYDNRIKSWQ